MQNLLNFKKRVNSNNLESDTFYAGLFQNISFFLNINSISESRLKLGHYLEMSRMLHSKTSEDCAIPVEYLNVETIKNRKLYFVEELRRILLYEIRICSNREQSHVFKLMHMYLHLIQLNMTQEMSMFEKINDFLNVNFKLPENNLISNAVRGNLGRVVEIDPGLNTAVEEYVSGIKTENFSISAWKSKNRTPDFLYEVFDGRFKDFSSIMEFVCYGLKYIPSFDVTLYTNRCLLLKLLVDGNPFFIVENSNVDSLNLILSLLKPAVFDFQIEKFQDLFEKLFIEIESLNLHGALPFLSFSKNRELFFNIAINRIKPEKMNVDGIIAFGKQIRIDASIAIDRFAYHLQNTAQYHQLMKFLIKNNVLGFKYTEESMLYFIENFESFSFIIEIDFIEDDTNLFIYQIGNIERADEKALKYLLQHEKFYCCAGPIVKALCKSKNKDLLLTALKKILDAENAGICIDHAYKKEIIGGLGE